VNTLANSRWVTKEVARGFVNSVVFLANVNRTYDGQYVQAGAKVGNTVQARLPQRFYAADGQAMQIQAIYDQTVPITLTNQKHVAFSWSSAEETTELDNVRVRFVQPGADALANVADVLAFQAVYRDVYQSVGVPGTTVSAIQTYLNAGVKLTDSSTPLTSRVAVLDTLAMATIAGTASALFNPSAVQSENYREGMFGRRQLGIEEWFQDQNRPVHTTGTFIASTPVVVGAGQTGTVLLTSGWGAGAAVKKGDVFTIAGVFQVNPQSYASVGRLQQFVLTSDAVESGGNMTLNLSPPIITSGQLQTVTNAPAATAAISVLGATNPVAGTLATTTSPQSLVYHPDAFAFVMADLIKPGAGAKASVARSKQYGFSVRMVEQYQIGSDQNPTRLDILIGAATLQARLATRVWG
jgi:hypothetical protein